MYTFSKVSWKKKTQQLWVPLQPEEGSNQIKKKNFLNVPGSIFPVIASFWRIFVNKFVIPSHHIKNKQTCVSFMLEGNKFHQQ